MFITKVVWFFPQSLLTWILQCNADWITPRLSLSYYPFYTDPYYDKNNLNVWNYRMIFLYATALNIVVIFVYMGCFDTAWDQFLLWRYLTRIRKRNCWTINLIRFAHSLSLMNGHWIMIRKVYCDRHKAGTNV